MKKKTLSALACSALAAIACAVVAPTSAFATSQPKVAVTGCVRHEEQSGATAWTGCHAVMSSKRMTYKLEKISVSFTYDCRVDAQGNVEITSYDLGEVKNLTDVFLTRANASTLDVHYVFATFGVWHFTAADPAKLGM